MTFQEDKKFWTEFLQMYKDRPCLWELKSKEYNNKYSKNIAYADLIRKCREIRPGANCVYVKKKLQSLRASFRRQFKRVQQSTTECPVLPSLWYYDLMLFLVEQDDINPEISFEASKNPYDEDGAYDSDDNSSDVLYPSAQTVQALPKEEHTPNPARKRARAEENVTRIPKKFQSVDGASSSVTRDTTEDDFDISTELESISETNKNVTLTENATQNTTEDDRGTLGGGSATPNSKPTHKSGESSEKKVQRIKTRFHPDVVYVEEDSTEDDCVISNVGLPENNARHTRNRLNPEDVLSYTMTEGTTGDYSAISYRRSGRHKKLRAAPQENVTHAKKTGVTEDDCVVFGQSVGLELRLIPSVEQRDVAKKLISDVLFYAKSGKLTFDSCIDALADQTL